MNHKELSAWIQSMDMTEEIYSLTRKFPKDELFGLTSQLRRAVASIPTNIAEGAGRNNDKEMIQFLYIALGSNSELETLLLICKRVHYIDDAILMSLSGKLNQIKITILGLVKYLKNKK